MDDTLGKVELYKRALNVTELSALEQTCLMGAHSVPAVIDSATLNSIMNLQDDLTTAAATGNAAAVRQLLDSGARVNGENRFGRTALQVMMMGSVPVANLLLNFGADPNVRDRSTGDTPLHDAARTGFTDTVRLLVQFQADPNALNNENRRPIDVARQNGNSEVVDFLETL